MVALFQSAVLKYVVIIMASIIHAAFQHFPCASELMFESAIQQKLPLFYPMIDPIRGDIAAIV